MYRSPIEIIYGQMETQMEGDILRAVQKYGINVDKEELLRALQYDRNQYEKGYADGKADAMAELVRCKDCIELDRTERFDNLLSGTVRFYCPYANGYVPLNHFCSHGERKDDDTTTDKA